MVWGFESPPAHQQRNQKVLLIMAVTVETLDKLERRITLTLAADTINNEVQSRLKRLSRTVKADGFRPGKVPMSVVAQRYGYSVQHEVMNDKVGQVFSDAVNEAKLRVAGAPRIAQKEDAPEGQIAFETLLRRFSDMQLALPAESLPWRRGVFLRGLERLPLRVRVAPTVAA